MASFAFFGMDGKLDRAALMRRDTAKVAQAFSDCRVMLLWQGKMAVDGERRGVLWLKSSHQAVRGAVQAGGVQIYLGQNEGTHHFAIELAHWQPAESASPSGYGDDSITFHPDLPQDAGFVDLRMMLMQLSPFDGECAATARALAMWHARHGFCALCGAPSHVIHAGWQRQCSACDAAHFPRTDPVVIMLVQRANNLLLGRSPGWPEGMYSLLAGFVEPGEMLESAVRREVAEETGVKLGAVRYLSSQPWPFPANLMLGCVAEAISSEITLDPAELEDAVWLSKAEVLQVQLGQHPKVRPARKGAIAQSIIEDWLAGRID